MDALHRRGLCSNTAKPGLGGSLGTIIVTGLRIYMHSLEESVIYKF